jgi:hypothetical protein
VSEKRKVLISDLGGQLYAQQVKDVDGVPAVADLSGVLIGKVWQMVAYKVSNGERLKQLRWYTEDIAHRVFGPKATKAKAIDELLDWLDLEHATVQDTLKELF